MRSMLSTCPYYLMYAISLFERSLGIIDHSWRKFTTQYRCLPSDDYLS